MKANYRGKMERDWEKVDNLHTSQLSDEATPSLKIKRPL